MSRAKVKFQDLVHSTIKNDGELVGLLPVVEKEILHYDILNAMHQRGYFKHLVFQGETCLRLIYGSNRFSEDLDFVGGVDFDQSVVDGLADTISSYLTARYGLSVRVKAPKKKESEGGVNVSAWQISIETAPERRDLPRQRIKLEIANVSAQTKTVRQLLKNYEHLPPSMTGLLVPVETPVEILADKLVSLPAVTSHIRHRDIWDIGFLVQTYNKEAKTISSEMIQKKIEEYGIPDFEEKLSSRIESLSEAIQSNAFDSEIRRFLPQSVLNRTLDQDGFKLFLSDTVSAALNNVRNLLYSNQNEQQPIFRM